MGLSLLSANALRGRSFSSLSGRSLRATSERAKSLFQFKKPPPSTNPPPTPPDTPRTANSQKSNRRPKRLKDLDAAQLVSYLETFSFETVASSETVSNLTDRVSSDRTLLSGLIDILCHPTKNFEAGDEAARDRVSSAWIVSCLLRYGGDEISDALASPQNTYIERLAHVLIDSKAGSLDAAHVQCVLDIIRYQLQSHPKHTVSALPLKGSFIPALVKHISLQPVVEFLPRLVGTRAFPARGLSTPILPAHKRALAALASTKVLDKLADTYIEASGDIIDNSSSSTDGFLMTSSSSSSNQPINSTKNKVAAHDVVAATCETMAEIGARASSLYLKEEEPDERSDGAFSSGLGIVTAAVYNDSKKYLDPYYNPRPYLRVIEKVITDIDFLDDDCTKDHEKYSVVLLPPLRMLIYVMQAWKETDPAHRTNLFTKENPVASILGNSIGPLWVGICRLLSLSGGTPCAVHLAVIDLLQIAALIFDDAKSRNYLYSVDVIQAIKSAMERFKQNDLFVTSCCRFLASLINHREEVSNVKTQLKLIVNLTNHALKDNYAASPIVSALDQMNIDEGRTSDGEERNDWDAWCQLAKEQRQSGPALKRRRSESELAIAGEDLTHELYVFTHINEAKAEHKNPPTDDFIGEAVDAGIAHRGRGRLTAMLHL